jgi:hypothetical protein
MVQVQVQAQGLSGKSGRDTGREGALTSSFAALFFAMGFDAAASVSAGAAGAAEAGSTLSPLPVAPTSDILRTRRNELLGRSSTHSNSLNSGFRAFLESTDVGRPRLTSRTHFHSFGIAVGGHGNFCS